MPTDIWLSISFQVNARRLTSVRADDHAAIQPIRGYSDMKLSDKLSTATFRAPQWETYNCCADAIGYILDNKFENPHVIVYEHARHTRSEVFKDEQRDSETPTLTTDLDETLAGEEEHLLRRLQAAEIHRRINIIGHVGAGKTTFIKHLIALHFDTEQFGPTIPIYIDYSSFNAPLDDPLPEIRTKFCDTIWATLEKLFGRDEMRKIDDKVFETAEMFAMPRATADRHDGRERQAYIRDEIDRVIRSSSGSVKFTIARLNVLSEENKNRLILIVDNIDHLHEKILHRLSEFLLEVQISATPMLVVCMRDHTEMTGMSSLGASKTVPAWHMSLNPPNLSLMLNRRIEHFFGSNKENEQLVQVGNSVRFGVKKSKICRALLKSPFRDPETYEFICNYANYNLRDLFANLQRIVGFHGHSSRESILKVHEEPVFPIGIDECLISLALGSSLVFSPKHSFIFNAYSAGNDSPGRNRIVACRILQRLDNKQTWEPYSEVKRLFSTWGYDMDAVNVQVKAMINKDLIWTSTGDPSYFREDSQIKLSYRGQLYARKIMQHAIYNYIMSFDVNAPKENHPILSFHQSKIETELQSFSDFSAHFESETLARRVLALTEIIFEEEQEDVIYLKKKGEIENFRIKVSPRLISAEIATGLLQFLNKIYQEDNDRRSRFRPPPTTILAEVNEAIQRYEDPFVNMFLVAR